MDGTPNNHAESQAMPLKLDVSVRLIEPVNNLVAFANVTINDCFKVRGVKVVDGENGLFVDMPSAKTSQTNKDGTSIYQDVCYPVTADFRKQLHTAVLDGYDAAIEKAQLMVQTAENTQRAPVKEPIGDQIRGAAQKVKEHVTPPKAPGRVAEATH